MFWKYNSSNKNTEKGFTLVEILVSLVIILIMVMAFVPMYEYITQMMNSNKAKETATGLANQTLEEMRSLPYLVLDDTTGLPVTDPDVPQLGIKGGNPSGSIEPTQTKTIDGVTYTIQTRVFWEAEGSNPVAYKKVTVRVTSPNAFRGAAAVTSNFHTLAALEGESAAYKAGHISIEILDQNGVVWDSPEVQIHIESDTLEQDSYTDHGKTLFGIIPAGDYVVTAKIPSGMVTRPDEVIYDGWIRREATVDNWSTTTVGFYIDYPGHINLTLNDSSTEDSIIGNGDLNLTWKDGTATVPLPKTAFTGSQFNNSRLPASVIGNLWPGGTYSINLENVLDTTTYKAYYSYDMAESTAVKPKLNSADWDGRMGEAGSTINLSINLHSALKTHLTADTDSVATTSVPIDPANPDGETVNQVTAWNDSSDCDSNAEPYDDSSRPLFIENVVNNLPVIRFSDAQRMVIANSNVPYDSFTIFAVVKPEIPHEVDSESADSPTDGETGQHYLFWPTQGTSSSAGAGISLGTNGISNYEYSSYCFPATSVYDADTSGITGFNVISLLYDERIPFIYLNNQQVSTRHTASIFARVNSPIDIGGGEYGNFTGDIAEILIYDTAISDDNRDVIHDYLKAKYGIIEP